MGPCANAMDECLDPGQLLDENYILHSMFVKPTACQRPEQLNEASSVMRRYCLEK